MRGKPITKLPRPIQTDLGPGDPGDLARMRGEGLRHIIIPPSLFWLPHNIINTTPYCLPVYWPPSSISPGPNPLLIIC